MPCNQAPMAARRALADELWTRINIEFYSDLVDGYSPLVD